LGRQVILSAGWALDGIGISAPADQFLEFGSAVVTGIFEDRHAFTVTQPGSKTNYHMIMHRRTFLTGGLSFAATAGITLAGGFGSGRMVKIVEFTETGKRESEIQVEKVQKTDEEWKRQLSPEQYQVTRRAGTERAFTGKYWKNHEHGMYRCVCCGNALFSSDTKFESGTGWPSFYEPIAKQNVTVKRDVSFGMARTEVLCAKCDAHLGHVFDDGPRPTGLRYCMNSASLDFVKS
jgi:peptide-methionine (R)-S-oxide reductase